MKSIRFYTQLILPLVLIPPLAHAGEVLGFGLGEDSFEAVIQKLEHRKAVFDPNYTYRGDDRLKLIKVNADASLRRSSPR